MEKRQTTEAEHKGTNYCDPSYIPSHLLQGSDSVAELLDPTSKQENKSAKKEDARSKLECIGGAVPPHHSAPPMHADQPNKVSSVQPNIPESVEDHKEELESEKLSVISMAIQKGNKEDDEDEIVKQENQIRLEEDPNGLKIDLTDQEEHIPFKDSGVLKEGIVILYFIPSFNQQNLLVNVPLEIRDRPIEAHSNANNIENKESDCDSPIKNQSAELNDRYIDTSKSSKDLVSEVQKIDKMKKTNARPITVVSEVQCQEDSQEEDK